MCSKRFAIDDPVSGIPSSVWASAVQQHLHSDAHATLKLAAIRARATLFQRDESDSRWNDPTRTPRHPRPPKFVRVEPNLAVNQFEFPAPQPVALLATCAKKPLSRFVASRDRKSTRLNSSHLGIS